MIVNGERELAYIAKITNIESIPNYDRVELATINDGWRVIISKEDKFNIGDLCVYFEVDSKVPEDDIRFAFLMKRKYKIKTIKMCGVISQGLVMPVSAFEEIKNPEEGMAVTKLLGVTYAVAADNERKSSGINPNAKYNSMSARHANLAKKRWWRWLMKRDWGKKLLFVFFGKKKDSPKGFPSFVSKTDEERVENMPWVLKDSDKEWFATEKLDGTSCTYALERKGKNKYEFYVCSRNVRQKDENQECYHDHNIYWDMAFKYDIENHLKHHLDIHKEDNWVCIQGEGVGGVQGNPLKLAEDDLYIFNFITSSRGRVSSDIARCNVESWGMKHVPILGVVTLPQTMEEMKEQAHANSIVNPNVLREGVVYRSLDGVQSFKNVDPIYLLKHNE